MSVLVFSIRQTLKISIAEMFHYSESCSADTVFRIRHASCFFLVPLQFGEWWHQGRRMLTVVRQATSVMHLTIYLVLLCDCGIHSMDDWQWSSALEKVSPHLKIFKPCRYFLNQISHQHNHLLYMTHSTVWKYSRK